MSADEVLSVGGVESCATATMPPPEELVSGSCP